MSDLVIEVSEGKLQGKVCRTFTNSEYFAFKGIPYAKPPIGDLRFTIPDAPDPWNGIRDATKNCNISAQLDKTTGLVIGDEDCLYLNVYTPKLPVAESSNLPVIAFIHGGGFVRGTGTDDEAHGPDLLIENNVVVCINYRLGILGFLSLDRKEAPGNMGLRDQVQALKWIQQNITKFGGDKNNVTVLGVSAGAASVEYLMLSPMARGLFHKAIAQSGSSLNHWTHNDDIKKLALQIPLLEGKNVTDPDKLYMYLKYMPVKDLIATSMLAIANDKWRGGIHYGFVPTVEKPNGWEPFLDKSTYDLLREGNFTIVPFMTGFCSHEGLLMVKVGQQILEKLTRDKVLNEHLPFLMDDEDRSAFEGRLKSIYLPNNEATDDFAIDLFTDIDFFGGIYVAASLIAKRNPSVYFYEFSYDGGLNYLKKKMDINRPGICHGDDTGYIIKSNMLTENLSEIDKLVQKRMVDMWTNFVRTGEPTPKTDDVITTKWDPITDTNFCYMRIDDKLTMKDNLLPERAKLYEELYEKYYGKKHT